jgi:hypothetical protein
MTPRMKVFQLALLVAIPVTGIACKQAPQSRLTPTDSATQQRARDSTFEALVMADVRRPFPTDSELGTRWRQHQTLFDQLIVMARVDSELVRIAPDFTWTRKSVAWPRAASDLGFSQDRWDQYRRLFKGLGLEAGLLHRSQDEPRIIYLMAQTKGLVTSGSAKGYAYSDAHLEPQCQSLDRSRGDSRSGICYKPLGGNWYLYLEWD